MAHPTRLFQTEKDLWLAFQSYKLDLVRQANEWLKLQYVGKEGERKTDAQKVPKTLEGFYSFCYGHYGYVHQYFENKDGYYNEFVEVCSRIKNEIREDQIIGGLLGFYNPSITQRLNNLRDGVDVKTEGEKTVTVKFKKGR